jgi:hypothetical protein
MTLLTTVDFYPMRCSRHGEERGGAHGNGSHTIPWLFRVPFRTTSERNKQDWSSAKGPASNTDLDNEAYKKKKKIWRADQHY